MPVSQGRNSETLDAHDHERHTSQQDSGTEIVRPPCSPQKRPSRQYKVAKGGRHNFGRSGERVEVITLWRIRGIARGSPASVQQAHSPSQPMRTARVWRARGASLRLRRRGKERVQTQYEFGATEIGGRLRGGGGRNTLRGPALTSTRSRHSATSTTGQVQGCAARQPCPSSRTNQRGDRRSGIDLPKPAPFIATPEGRRATATASERLGRNWGARHDRLKHDGEDE
jgi:hypothetical protein